MSQVILVEHGEENEKEDSTVLSQQPPENFLAKIYKFTKTRTTSETSQVLAPAKILGFTNSALIWYWFVANLRPHYFTPCSSP